VVLLGRPRDGSLDEVAVHAEEGAGRQVVAEAAVAGTALEDASSGPSSSGSAESLGLGAR
jgi:hypothetical protein